MLFCMANGCSFQVIKGDGNVVTKSFPIGDYDKIEIAGGVEFDYTQSAATPALEVTLDENFFDCLDIYVKDNVLIIKKKEDYNETGIAPTVYRIKSNSSALSKLKNTGSCTFNILNQLNTSNLDIKLTGSGSVVCKDNMRADDLNVTITGSGSAVLKGEVDQAKIKISGSGDIDAYECRINSLECNISGSGAVKAWVINDLSYNITGSGNLIYKGNPQLKEQSISGSGKVKNIEN